jgi:hypothetical protein
VILQLRDIRYVRKDHALHRLVAIVSSALLATPVMLALGSGAALADGSAPSPICDTSTPRFWICDPTAGSAPYTWTIKMVFPLNIGNTTTTNQRGYGGCSAGENLTVTYSYVSNGVTFDSDPSTFICNGGPPR